MRTKSDFSEEPLEMLEVALKYFIGNIPMPEELKESVKNNIECLSKIPEGIILEKIDPFLEANIFEHDLKDLVDCGIYSFIYSNALSLVPGSRAVANT